MARINLEDQFWIQIGGLAAKLGDYDRAVGMAVRWFRYAQEKHKEGKLVSERDFARDGFSEALIPEFAERVDGGIQCVGAEKQFGWLRAKREAGRKGGLKRAENARTGSDELLRRRANQAVQKAVQQGQIQRAEACERCGSPENIQAHHEDYSQPLQVEWLCAQCHADHHNKVFQSTSSETKQAQAGPSTVEHSQPSYSPSCYPSNSKLSAVEARARGAPAAAQEASPPKESPSAWSDIVPELVGNSVIETLVTGIPLEIQQQWVSDFDLKALKTTIKNCAAFFAAEDGQPPAAITSAAWAKRLTAWIKNERKTLKPKQLPPESAKEWKTPDPRAGKSPEELKAKAREFRRRLKQ